MGLTWLFAIFCTLLLFKDSRSTDDDKVEIKGRSEGLTLKDLIPQRVTTKTFLETIVGNDKLLLFYYIDEVHQVPEFVRAVNGACEQVQNRHPEFQFRYVNSALDTALIKSFNVAKVPLLKVYVQQIGIPFDTKDDQVTFEGLLSFIDEILRNKSPVVKKANEFKLKWNYSIFIYNSNKPFLNNIIDTIAMKYRYSANVFEVESPGVMDSIAKRFGLDIKSVGFVLLIHHQHSQQANIYDGPIHPFTMAKFLTDFTISNTTSFTQAVYEWAVQEKLVILAFFYHNPEYVREKVEVMKQLSQHIQEKQTVAVLADMNSDFVREFAAKHGIIDFFDCLMAFEPFALGTPKYLFESHTFNVAEILEFLNNIHSKSENRFYKSEAPDERIQGVVRVGTDKLRSQWAKISAIRLHGTEISTSWSSSTIERPTVYALIDSVCRRLPTGSERPA